MTVRLVLQKNSSLKITIYFIDHPVSISSIFPFLMILPFFFDKNHLDNNTEYSA